MLLDTRNGREVAAMMGNFLNGYYNHYRFFAELAKYRRPAHNFIVLVLYWCYELHKYPYWDQRNEASVMFAREVVAAAGIDQDYDWFAPLQHVRQMKNPYIPMPERGDAVAAAYALSCHLGEHNLRNSVFKDFVNTMLQENKTIQQTFTRICRGWCLYVVEACPMGANGKSVKLARPVAYNTHRLPMI